MTTKVNTQQLDGSDHESSSTIDVRKKQGNLHSLLTSYDKSQDKLGGVGGVGGGVGGVGVPPSEDASFQLDSVGAPRDRSSTLGSFRDRSFTFGSEFDLSIGFGELMPNETNTNTNTSTNTKGGGGGNGSIPTDISNVNPFTSQENVVSASSSNNSALPQASSTTATSPLSSPILRAQPDPTATGTTGTIGTTDTTGTTMTSTNYPAIKSTDSTTTTSSTSTTKPSNTSDLRQPLPNFPGVSYVNYSTKQLNTNTNATTNLNANNNNDTSNDINSNINTNMDTTTTSSTSDPSSNTNMNMNMNTISIPIPTRTTTNTSTNINTNESPALPPSSSQDSHVSASSTGFLSGMFGGSGSGNQTPIDHTPPSANPTSYEVKHFGKRMRSESISGRLRSMSDLEDRGIIDNKQKGALKDLIIAGGDDSLQVALDKYEKGDPSALKEMLNSGILQTKNMDIDLMGDLDLDFLNMSDADGYDNESVSVGGAASVSNSVSGSVSVSQTTASKAMPIPIVNQNHQGMNVMNDGNTVGSNHGGGSGTSTPRYRGESPMPTSQAFDGIGELEFNGEYPNSGNEDNNFMSVSIPQTQTTQAPNVTIAVPNTGNKSRSNSFLSDTHRLRANSLAFGGLLEEPTSDQDQEPIGKWMDLIPEGRSKPIKKRAPQAVNGTLFNINAIQGPQGQSQEQVQVQEETQKKKQPAGTRQGKQTKAMKRADIVAQKKREREEKRAMKEREKQLKKEQREREMRERKERKEMKKAAKKTSDVSPPKRKREIEEVENDEGPKEVVSGTGRPRSLSDPNLTIRLDENGLMNVQGPPDWVGAYSPPSRKIRIERFLAKRNHRVWVKKVKYDVRKNFADSRLRVKGRFVKKEDELLMRDLMSLT